MGTVQGRGGVVVPRGGVVVPRRIGPRQIGQRHRIAGGADGLQFFFQARSRLPDPDAVGGSGAGHQQEQGQSEEGEEVFHGRFSHQFAPARCRVTCL